MEVKIGVQHAPRELVLDTDETAEDVEKQVAEAVAGERRPRAHRQQGPRVIVPAEDRLRRDRRRRRGQSASAADARQERGRRHGLWTILWAPHRRHHHRLLGKLSPGRRTTSRSG